ncbi:hypothetical protein [Gaoshiqia sp. Z1-71]|uniref:hypothetical protein n=1 Tax=Gaoshiqia hydrogeniformans TaxID=3290090 RepID=UPI003BF77886
MKKSNVGDRFSISAFLLLSLLCLSFAGAMAANGLKKGSSKAVIENARFRYEIAANGNNLHFIDKMSGIDYLDADRVSSCAFVTKAGREYPVSAVSFDGNQLELTFAGAGVFARIRVKGEENYITLAIAEISGSPESLTFLNIPLTLEGMPYEPFASCALSMNLQTNVLQLPVLQTHLQATCYQRFGMSKAKVALLGVPQNDILPVIREVTKNAKDIPFSGVGGAWALEAKEGYGSYVFNFGELTEETAGEWIEMCKNVGFSQIDNHGRSDFFRFGDFELNREKWPDGWDSFKRINDKLHDAGISSIFHTYAFYIDKKASYVTPVPSEDLDYFKIFTLDKPAGETDTELTVKESTADISTITGMFLNNSTTIRIGKELITFSGVTKTAPYRLTGCKRGVLGTNAFSHPAGEKAYQLKEKFNRFVPGPETPLFREIARRTAEIVDRAGFDGVYFDAIDGSDILAGRENSWYYATKFVFEVAKNLKRPVGMEMSSMHHHFWNYRSRWQAWDRPVRGYKRFVDIHSAAIKLSKGQSSIRNIDTTLIKRTANVENGGLMLPLQLGWWGHESWNPPQVEPTFPDDVEYIACKMIGNNAGLSMLRGFDEKTENEYPRYKRLNEIIRQYESLRHQNYFNDSVRVLLRQPGKEFTLIQEPGGKWNFKPVRFQKHRVAGTDHPSAHWQVMNEYGPQPVKLRIEPLMSVNSYADTTNIGVIGFDRLPNFDRPEAAKGVTGELVVSEEKTPEGEAAGLFMATSLGQVPQEASWAKIEKRFEPFLDLKENQAIGVWIKGDGNGQLLNLRVANPRHIAHGARADRFIHVDFTGWKYFELVEIESAEVSNYEWAPSFASLYDTYRHTVDFEKVDHFQFWYNNLPPGKTVETLIGPVRALSLVSNTINNPAVTIGGETIVFQVSMESGMFLEFRSASDCKLYDSKGGFIRDVPILGNIPELKTGENKLSFSCDSPGEVNPRVQVTVISEGEPLEN